VPARRCRPSRIRTRRARRAIGGAESDPSQSDDGHIDSRLDARLDMLAADNRHQQVDRHRAVGGGVTHLADRLAQFGRRSQPERAKPPAAATPAASSGPARPPPIPAWATGTSRRSRSSRSTDYLTAQAGPVLPVRRRDDARPFRREPRIPPGARR
jgi:hypothetical protein